MCTMKNLFPLIQNDLESHISDKTRVEKILSDLKLNGFDDADNFENTPDMFNQLSDVLQMHGISDEVIKIIIQDLEGTAKE